VPTVVTRHEFLAELHGFLRPATYLEIGVQFGYSLRLALAETYVIGVDPNPMCAMPAHLQGAIIQSTSDEYFEGDVRRADMTFIDGMHLIEYALRDFINAEAMSNPDGIILLDDVLPYSWDIAGREPLPGDWAGDVWKIWPILVSRRPDLKVVPVNVDPTGLLMVWRLDPHSNELRKNYEQLVQLWAKDTGRQPWIVERTGALDPEQAFQLIEEKVAQQT